MRDRKNNTNYQVIILIIGIVADVLAIISSILDILD